MTIQGMIYPVAPMTLLLSNLLTFIFVAGLLVCFAGGTIFDNKYFRFEPGLRLHKWMSENQIPTIALLFVCNMISNNLTNSGAFEVFFDDQLVFSRRATGRLPDVQVLLARLNDAAN